MESTARVSTDSIFQLVLYKAIVIFIYCQSSWKHTGQSWNHLENSSLQQNYYHTKRGCTRKLQYAQRDPDEVDREEHNCKRLSRQFGHLMKEYRERCFTYVLFQSPTRSVAAHLEMYLLHVYYTSQLDNLYHNREINQLELDWITRQRDYAQNKTWGDSRTSILKAMQCKLQIFRIYRTSIKFLPLLYIHMRGPIHHQFECIVVPIICRYSISKIQRKERL